MAAVTWGTTATGEALHVASTDPPPVPLQPTAGWSLCGLVLVDTSRRFRLLPQKRRALGLCLSCWRSWPVAKARWIAAVAELN